MLLASCGVEIKFHYWPDGNYHGGYAFDGGDVQNRSIRNISWNCDGQSIVSVPFAGEPAVIGVHPTVVPLQGISVPNVIVANCSRTKPSLVALGTSTGSILLYCTSRKSITQQFSSLPSEIKFLGYGAHDSYLCAGNSHGQIFLYNQHSVLHTAFAMPKSSKLTAMATHSSDPKILAAASAEGAVAIWDTCTTDVQFYETVHHAAVTDVSLSPDHHVVATVGLDGTLKEYDICSKQCSFSTVAGAQRLSSIAYMPGSQYLGVASMDGKLYCFDRRKTTLPVNVIEAHSRTIWKIAFPNSASADFSKNVVVGDTCSAHSSKTLVDDRCCLEKKTSNSSIISDASTLIFNDRRIYKHTQNDVHNTPTFGGSAGKCISPIPHNLESFSEYNYPNRLGELESCKMRKEITTAVETVLKELGNVIANEFLKMRLSVSRQFVNLEEKMNERWDNFNTTLRNLVSEQPDDVSDVMSTIRNGSITE